MLPLSILLFPDPGLFVSTGTGCPVTAHSLLQTNVADYRSIGSQHADVWRGDCGVDGHSMRKIVEVELVKGHAMNQVATGLWLKTTEAVVAEFGVSVPVSGGNTVQQFLSQINQVVGLVVCGVHIICSPVLVCVGNR